MKYILVGIAMCLSLPIFAQQRVTGKVTDSSGVALPFVNVILKNSSVGTTTNSNGVYELELTDLNGDLEFSSLGFESKTVSIDGRDRINVSLIEAEALLNEVVITALGLERETRELGYAVQSVESGEISEVKSPNFIDNLGGKLAGVTVSQGATGVGSSTKIVIRGEASFSNNNPLFIVDGTPINNNTVFPRTSEAAAGFQEVDFGNGAMEVNPDDIASVSVLKGPSAAALYGTRASNGVIIIETKDGSKAQGVGVSINSSVFIDTPFQLPKFQNEYGQGNSGEFEFVDGLGGGVNDLITYSWGPRLDAGNMIPQFDSPVMLADGTVVRGGDTSVYGNEAISATPFVSHPDNLKDFYRTGVTTINNAAVSSGFSNGNYRLAFTDLRSESILPGVDLDRQTVAAKLNFKPLKGLAVNATVNYVNSGSDNRPANGYGSENLNYSLVAWGPRSLNINSLKDYWQPGLENVQQFSYNYTYFDNPYFIMYENTNSFGRDRVFGNISARQQITPNLSLSVRSGMDYSSELRKFKRAFSSNRFKNGAYGEQEVVFREVNTDFLLNYNRDFGIFSADISLGGNRLDQYASNKQSQASTLAQPGIFKLTNAAAPVEIYQYESKKRINSFYGIAKFGYKDFLFLDVTGRNDWSSSLATPFSVDNTSFFYPSVSSSFILSEVTDLPEAISYAQLRASWAQVGNDTDPYQTTGAFVAQTPYLSQPTFSDQDFIANPNLRPEQTTSFEVGADIRFFRDRLSFDLTYYNALTEDQILSLPIGISSGYTQKVVNAGKVRSKGVEIIAGAVPVLSDNFRWDTKINFSRNISEVEELPQEAGRLTLAYNRVYDNPDQTVWLQVEEGGRIGDLYGTGYQKTDDGRFILTEGGRYIANNELQKLGNYNPDFMMGINNEFSYKNWNLSFLFDWRQGGILVSRTLSLAAVGGQLEETLPGREDGVVPSGVVNIGTPENPNYVESTARVSAESYYRQFYDRNHEENNVYDASYLKLRQFSLGYTFDLKKNALGFMKEGGTVNLALIGRNLFALSEIPHFDPEQLAVQGNGFVSGVEDMSYATTRSIGFKAGINF
ncbi:MAG: SusC/RagA family TonB-linked outer membrane protein [Christiangramia sp.]